MSDARGFMVAAYVLTLLTLLIYGIRLWTASRAVERRLDAARAARSFVDPDPVPHGAPDTSHRHEAAMGGHHVQA